jgi:hypothetical protein
MEKLLMSALVLDNCMTTGKKSCGRTAGGTPITDALVQRLAKEGEKGYDVDRMLARRHDPMLRALACASFDDEPSDSDEDSSAAAAISAYHHGEGTPSDQLRADLDDD